VKFIIKKNIKTGNFGFLMFMVQCAVAWAKPPSFSVLGYASAFSAVRAKILSLQFFQSLVFRKGSHRSAKNHCGNFVVP